MMIQRAIKFIVVFLLFIIAVRPGWTQATTGAPSLTFKKDNVLYDVISFDRLFFKYQPPVDVEHPDGNVTKARTAPMVIPDDIKALNGKKVAIQGFIIPLANTEKNLKEFLFADELVTCLFCQMLGYDQWIMATVADPKGIRVNDDQYEEAGTIYGTFEVGEKFEDGHFTSLYRLKVDGIKFPRKKILGLF